MSILKRLSVFAAGAAMLCLSFSANADEQYKLVAKSNPNADFRFIYQKDLHFRVDKDDKSKLEIVDHKSDLNYAVFTASMGNSIIYVVYFEDFPDHSVKRKGTTTSGYKIDYRPYASRKDCPELRKDHLSGRLHPVWSHITAKWKNEDEFTLGFHLCEDPSSEAYIKTKGTRIKN